MGIGLPPHGCKMFVLSCDKDAAELCAAVGVWRKLGRSDQRGIGNRLWNATGIGPFRPPPEGNRHSLIG